MIEGVKIKKLKIISDDRGFLMEILRNDDEIFQKFGQIYMTMVKRGIAKGWHYHKVQDDYVVCVSGKSLWVLYDTRKNSKTFGQVEEYVLAGPETEDKHILLKIPKGVIHGFTAVDCEQARVINIPTERYDYKNPDEYRYPWNSPKVPYQWPDYVKGGG